MEAAQAHHRGEGGVSLDPEELYARHRALGEKWADADAAYRLLDDTAKTVLAECEIEARNEGPTGTTQAAIERAGRVAAKYREHLEALAKSRREANRAKVNYDCYDTYIEMLRTKSANERAEANLR